MAGGSGAAGQRCFAVAAAVFLLLQQLVEAFGGVLEIYLPDPERHVVWMCTPGVRDCTAVVGTAGTPGDGLNQLNFPVDVALEQGLDGSLNALIVSDQQNKRILRCVPQVSDCTVVAGNGVKHATSVDLKQPFQIALEQDVNATLRSIFIMDHVSKRLIRCVPAGDCTIIVEGVSYGVVLDQAFDGSIRSLYITDINGGVLRCSLAGSCEELVKVFAPHFLALEQGIDGTAKSLVIAAFGERRIIQCTLAKAVSCKTLFSVGKPVVLNDTFHPSGIALQQGLDGSMLSVVLTDRSGRQTWQCKPDAEEAGEATCSAVVFKDQMPSSAHNVAILQALSIPAWRRQAYLQQNQLEELKVQGRASIERAASRQQELQEKLAAVQQMAADEKAALKDVRGEISQAESTRTLLITIFCVALPVSILSTLGVSANKWRQSARGRRPSDAVLELPEVKAPFTIASDYCMEDGDEGGHLASLGVVEDMQPAVSSSVPAAAAPVRQGSRCSVLNRKGLPPGHLLFSGRFDGSTAEDLIRGVHREVRLRHPDIPVFIVTAKHGQQFGEQTMYGMGKMHCMAAFCGSKYGEKTDSKYSTYFELKHAYDNDIPVIPIKLCKEWPPQGGNEAGRLQNGFVFKKDLIYMDCYNQTLDHAVLADKLASVYRGMMEDTT